MSPTETSDSQSPVVKRRPRRARTQEKENTQDPVMEAYKVELETKVHTKFVITEKTPTRAFSWLKVPTCAFTFKLVLRHYAKLALTPGK